MSGREALTVATQGGAKVLGRDDIGRIAPGMAADFVAWRTDCLCLSGAQHDLVAALVFCTPGLPSVDLSVINGDVIVKDGQMLTCNVKVCDSVLAATAAVDPYGCAAAACSTVLCDKVQPVDAGMSVSRSVCQYGYTRKPFIDSWINMLHEDFWQQHLLWIVLLLQAVTVGL